MIPTGWSGLSVSEGGNLRDLHEVPTRYALTVKDHCCQHTVCSDKKDSITWGIEHPQLAESVGNIPKKDV